jgi:diadenylate cyclase
LSVFQGFRLQDALDILIIAVILYQAYALLVGSRAWNVVRGFAGLALLWLIAEQLQMEATEWLFDAVAPVGFIALVVVFQPELRAVLERFGRGRLRSSAKGDPVQEIMTAVRELATQRKGALIAIEQRTPLKEYCETGTPIGAPVTAALLQTVFASTGPLHDGAVVIKEDVVTHAGAVLPLSDKHEGWSVKHGTRHRAALGLSEVTDAIVIVVSEERGTVSVARGGELKTDIAPSEVLTTLQEAYS